MEKGTLDSELEKPISTCTFCIVEKLEVLISTPGASWYKSLSLSTQLLIPTTITIVHANQNLLISNSFCLCDTLVRFVFKRNP